MDWQSRFKVNFLDEVEMLCNVHKKTLPMTGIMIPASFMKMVPSYYNPDGTLPKYILGCAAEDDYTGFFKIVMYFGGDEIFAGEAPEYGKGRRRNVD